MVIINGGTKKLVSKILIACEYTGLVRDCFIRLGYNAISCDLLPTERKGPHYQGDVRDILDDDWDLMIAFPPCTHLAISGAKHFEEKYKAGLQKEALDFVKLLLWRTKIPRIALENPVSLINSKISKPSQIIQPWQFGHSETKKTCLWLKNLPNLKPTLVVAGREEKIFNAPGGKNRGKNRSRTYYGIAKAMAEQWGPLLPKNSK